jgi:trans-aconitate methyltransferase
VTLTNWLLERSFVYRAWQLPFAERKLRPVVSGGDITRARRVLDVGCGPGTNAPHFVSADYVGIDINPEYIESARKRFRRQFIAADVTQYSATDQGKFDFIFVNSLLHHIDTPDVRRLLAHLSTLLTSDGYVHILDLVMPDNRRSIAGMLARADRGNFPRPIAEWHQLFSDAYNIVHFEPYPLGLGRLPLWNMLYCKGRAR